MTWPICAKIAADGVGRHGRMSWWQRAKGKHQMIRHGTRSVLLAGLLAMPVSSHAKTSVGPAFISGNELLAKCQAVPLYKASPNDPNKSVAEVTRENAEAMAAGGYCLGFIAGASDMIEAATSNFVCRPEDTTIGKIEELFIDYLRHHPDKGEQSAVGLVGSALGEAFHC
jgi:Rap1a immunity proteins